MPGPFCEAWPGTSGTIKLCDMKTMIRKELEKIRRENPASGSGLSLYPRLLFRLLRLCGYLLKGRWAMRSARKAGRLVFLRGRLKLENKGTLKIGNKVRIWSSIHPSQIYVEKSAHLTVGDGCYINGAFIAVCRRVSIGKNCFLGPMAHVQDSPFFGLDAGQAAAHAQPVIIEDDAWLAARCTIVGGVRIGRGAVVAVGAVVVEDVPPYCVVAGNPARVVKQIRPEPLPEPHSKEASCRNKKKTLHKT